MQEEILKSNTAGLPEKTASNLFRDFIFIAALCCAVFNGSWLTLAKFSWVLLAILFALDFRYAIYSILFFAAFFHPSGFFQNDVFTVKHLHIALFLASVIQIFKKKWILSWVVGFRENRLFYPLYLSALLTAVLAFLRQENQKTFLLTANFMSILLIFTYVYGAFRDYRDKLKSGMLFFLFGTSLQCVIGFSNFMTENYWWNMILIHNNYLGVLCAVSIFYALAYLFSEKKKKVRRLMTMILAGCLSLTLIFSCSRTAWLGFAAAYFFLFIGQRFYAYQTQVKASWRRFIVAGIIFWIILQFAGQVNPSVRDRMSQVWGLKEMKAWQYVLIDKENFAFLGAHRRNQLKEFREIMKKDAVLGKGLTHAVTDFHSLYLTLMAGTGLLGFSLFLYFCWQYILRLHRSLLEKPQTNFLFKLASLGAFITWLIISFFENRLLQYPVWTSLFIGILFSSPPEELLEIGRSETEAA